MGSGAGGGGNANFTISAVGTARKAILTAYRWVPAGQTVNVDAYATTITLLATH